MLETLWLFATAPARLMPYLWPVFVWMPLAMGGLGLVLRAVVLRRVPIDRIRPVMRSALTWFLALAGASFALLWLMISVVLLVLVLAAAAAGRQP